MQHEYLNEAANRQRHEIEAMEILVKGTNYATLCFSARVGDAVCRRGICDVYVTLWAHECTALPTCQKHEVLRTSATCGQTTASEGKETDGLCANINQTKRVVQHSLSEQTTELHEVPAALATKILPLSMHWYVLHFGADPNDLHGLKTESYTIGTTHL